MKAVELKIHNFRSICDATITLSNFNLLVGVNNAGKSTIIDALRAFYGKGVKFDQQKDFPCKGAQDQESWVEIEFKPSNEELEQLKDEYKSSNGTFRVRNYFYSTGASKKAGLYAYVNGELSEERFYGFKNVGQGEFGEIIYIPAVSKIDEHTKLTGPSALRDLINATLSKVVEKSDAYQELHSSFSNFENTVKLEETDEGYSLQSIESDISDEIAEWGAQFKLSVSPVGIDNIIKNLIQHELFDESLGSKQEISSYGQGFQRSIIYALIKVAAKYTTKKITAARKEFSPDLTWILFEEPEAFLHPTQISVLSKSLRQLSEGGSNQVLLSTHNPLFATHNIQDLPSFCRLHRENHQSRVFKFPNRF
ncbi:MAG: ATP-binding protein [Spirulinaceae cyanobacterium RM2_2_10]|nr:ATP-binding protein [Spirulinaceae cyanobacterium RM2_2_10]